MGIRNQKRETLKRLDSKTLDAKFLQEIQHGLNCSPYRVFFVSPRTISRDLNILRQTEPAVIIPLRSTVRVRHCRRQGLSAQDTAHILNCGVTLVETYLEIDIVMLGVCE